MTEPLSIATLTIVGGLAIFKIGKIILNLKNKKIVSNCCVKVDTLDLHESHHHDEIVNMSNDDGIAPRLTLQNEVKPITPDELAPPKKKPKNKQKKRSIEEMSEEIQ